MKTNLMFVLDHFQKAESQEEAKKRERSITNYYARLHRFTQFYLAVAEVQFPYFITLTQNTKYNKDRTNLQRFLYNLAHITKQTTEPILYIIEKHKEGGYHAHAITTEGGMKFIVHNYKSGFIYQEEAKTNIANELKKYMSKKQEGKRSFYANKSARELTKKRKKRVKEVKKLFERTGEISK